jgi:cytochrome c oxidase cbb3-type subunit 3
MSSAWSWYIIVMVAINILGCVWLLWWTGRSRGVTGSDGETTGHAWDDGAIREYNKPLPRWWLNLFYLTIVFSIGYLIWYPGLGSFAGTSGWSSQAQHDAERDRAEQALAPLFARFESMPIPDIAGDPDGLRLGRSVFANHCAMCHGSDARGALGFPNLADAAWNWGGEPDAILTSILAGREGVMPPLGAVLGSDLAITEVAVYTQSLSGQKVSAGMAAAGKRRYDTLCIACHGADGTGNQALGAPDLTDSAWVYGSSVEAIREGIIKGRHGQMPAHAEIIGPIRARLVAAWVWAQSQPASAQAAP